jgi:hypothetical protein
MALGDSICVLGLDGELFQELFHRSLDILQHLKNLKSLGSL